MADDGGRDDKTEGASPEAPAGAPAAPATPGAPAAPAGAPEAPGAPTALERALRAGGIDPAAPARAPDESEGAGADPAAPAVDEAPPPPPEEPKRDALGRAYGTGRRKESVGRVWIAPGSGAVSINGRSLASYFAREALRAHAMGPLRATEQAGRFDVRATVRGGGVSGQAGAVRHGLARALRAYDPTLKRVLRAEGMLTRDARVVERKKYGRHKARRSTQFSKR